MKAYKKENPQPLVNNQRFFCVLLQSYNVSHMESNPMRKSVLFAKQLVLGNGHAGQDRCFPPYGLENRRSFGIAWKAIGTRKGMECDTPTIRQYG